MTITSSDRPRIAASWRLAGELYEVHGDTALSTFDDWQAGAKAANLDPETRGNQWDADNECFIPLDPTGEAVLARRDEFSREFRSRVERMTEDAMWIRDAFHVLAPIVPPSAMNEKNTMWCDNCLRVGLANPRHRGELCRDCYDFRLTWGVPRPVALIRDRHLGKTITDKMVKAALEADGVILKTVGGVTKAVREARGGRKKNQNQKAKAS